MKCPATTQEARLSHYKLLSHPASNTAVKRHPCAKRALGAHSKRAEDVSSVLLLRDPARGEGRMKIEKLHVGALRFEQINNLRNTVSRPSPWGLHSWASVKTYAYELHYPIEKANH